jgi:vacuolar-type H+-ATPase subunit H
LCPISSIACSRSAASKGRRRGIVREASARAKALRASPERPADCVIKVIFAENEQQAEDLLSEVREPAPGIVGDE